jgi:hypothetical protein
MALAAIAKIINVSSVDATTFSNTSITPTSGRLYIVCVVNSKGTTPDTPTLSGTNGFNVTWTQIATITFNTIASPNARLTAFWGIASSSSAGVITSAYAGNTQTGFCQTIDEFTGFNATTPIVTANVVTARADTVTGVNCTLAALASTLNATFGTYSKSGNSTITPNGTFTELEDNGHGTPAHRLETQWKINATGSGGSSGSLDWAGIAFEINETSVGGAGGITLVNLERAFRGHSRGSARGSW